jgi:predicted dehydrogenase
MNIGLLGAGWFGREAHLRNLVRLPDVNVVAVASRSSENRRAAQEIVGDNMRALSDWRDVLKIESIDAVVISLPNDVHAEAAIEAFRAGKNVLCEKPLGLTITECDHVIAAAHAAGRVLQVGHEMRFQRVYQRMHSMIQAGNVGVPRIMWCREYRGPMRPGWRSSEAPTGGMLLEKNCHHFDLFHWLLNSRPVRVAAFGGRDVLTDREILDNAQVLVEFEDSRRAVLEICLFAPSGSDCEIGIVGDRGRIDTKNLAMTLCWHQFEPRTQHEERFSAHEDEASYIDAAGRVDRGIRAELEHFLDCCRTDRTPLTDGSSARLTTAVCLAAQEAIRRKQVVTIDEILNEH